MTTGPPGPNVRILVQLPYAGARIAALVPCQALTEINAEPDRAGVPIDLTRREPQHLADLPEYLDDITIDLDDPTAG
ncbi:hypothetical protein [Streptomyces albipurpureus]|uniref:Uncharacterized protein n=1 Tax=Streptomyces albipurpureus TaxID=2897419 RepID=A0ABT0UQ47_9ACTN|nr:hypothetical protein [Streptomyces sp. CWNU-1]MCM2390482.1 hypothetical protein [Streptomyces sp. CWNU-1]